MHILQVQVLLVELELLNVQDMERKVAKDQPGCLHAQQEKHLLLQWENAANLTRYRLNLIQETILLEIHNWIIQFG